MGGCDVVAMLRMGGIVCLELVLQARPFLRSADCFQYAAHRGKKFDVLDLQFRVPILKAICTVEQKGSGL